MYNFAKQEATEKIRNGIQKYNTACGIVTTKDSGYHETITLFYIWAVHKFLQANQTTKSIEELTNALLKSKIGEKQYPFEFYTKEKLFSLSARQGWIEPDVRDLA